MSRHKLPSLLIAWACTTWLAGCSSMAFWHTNGAPDQGGDPDNLKPAVVKAKPSVGEGSELELKMAKLWARVDDLEEEQFHQKERIRVLEKGLTLGLMPEELRTKDSRPPQAKLDRAKPDRQGTEKSSAKGRHKAKVSGAEQTGLAGDDESGEAAAPHAAEEDGVTPPAADDVEAAAGPAAAAALSANDSSRYQKLLANAQDEFRAGRYGRAIVDFSAITREFGNHVDGGMPLYWIAKSWQSMKEYNTSRQLYGEFLKQFPTSPWAPRAKLDLARVDWQLGNTDHAVQMLRELIQEHPYEDAAEMAKMELQTLDKKL